MLFIGYFLGRYIPGVDRHIESVIAIVDPRLDLAGHHRLVPSKESLMAFTLPALPYANDALEPHIDAQHDGNPPHQASPGLRQQPERRDREGARAGEQVARRSDARHQLASRRPCAARCATTAAATGTTRCSGSSWAAGKGGEPTGKLADAIKSAFGDFSEVQGAVRGRRRRPIRLGLGVARRRRRQAVDRRARRTRTTRSWTARPRSSASTSGSTRTT